MSVDELKTEYSTWEHTNKWIANAIRKAIKKAESTTSIVEEKPKVKKAAKKKSSVKKK